MEQNFVDTLAWDLPTLQELVLESCPGYVTAIREAAYQAALALVDRIEPSPGAGRLDRHYRTRSGTLLRTLDEVPQGEAKRSGAGYSRRRPFQIINHFSDQ